MHTPKAAALVLSCALVLLGCVAEKNPAPRGTRVDPGTRTAAPGAPAATLPAGPVATPAKANTTVSRVRVTVAPLGTIEYDGMQLPLISPDGSRVASATGETPSWELVLADAPPPSLPSSRLAAYALDRSGIRVIEWPQQPPEHCILGLSSNDEGFLVEQVRGESRRAIGLVNWATGATSWLAEGDAVNTRGVFTSRGELAFVRRTAGSAKWSLVLRTRQGTELRREAQDGDYLAVLPHPSPDVIYALRSGKSGIEVEAIRLRRSGDTPSAFGSVLASQNLTGAATPAAAHQLLLTVTPQPAPLAGESGDLLPLAVLSTRLQAACAFDVNTNRLVPLLPQSFAAAPVLGGNIRGYFAATDRHLFFVPWVDAQQATARNDARVLSSPYMLREVRSETEGPTAGLPRFILLGPVKNQPDRIEVTMMVPIGD
ncbi:MAG: hypothetical protein ACOYN0_02105 [Phycisphaerales bacterium]